MRALAREQEAELMHERTITGPHHARVRTLAGEQENEATRTSHAHVHAHARSNAGH